MKYTINIPKPCNENWNEMTPTERGKFCAVCKKDLYDFTRHSDYEILNRLRADKNICGRFRADQLNREYHIAETNKLKRWSILLGLTSFFAGAQPVFSQSTEVKTEIVEKDDAEDKNITATTQEYVTITGNVTDDTGMPLPGVNILIKGTTTGTQTDFDGDFILQIPKKYVNESRSLVFSYVGFVTQEIPYDMSVSKLNIKMYSDGIYEEELFIVGGLRVSPVRSLFYKIGNLFRKKH